MGSAVVSVRVVDPTRVGWLPIRSQLSYALGLGLPVVIALAFGHPTRQVLVPYAMMLSVTVLLTLVGGAVAGLLAVASSTVSLWFFNFPPGYSFRSDNPEDAVAAVVAGIVAAAMVLLVAEGVRRQREALVHQTRLGLEVAAQRDAATALQRAILPDWSPPFAGVALGWCYESGSDFSVPVGGDWYAFVPISSTRLGVAIGDVAGHGVSAVRHMAEYRYALRTVAGEGGSPPTVVARVHDTTRRYPGMQPSSCVYGQIDLAERTWTYCSAGHLPPLLVRNGEVSALPSPHGPLLGVVHGSVAYATTTIDVQPGDVLVLYTDGLVERRAEGIDTGIARLAEYLSDADLEEDLFAASRRLVAQMTVGSPTADDVAVVLIRIRGGAAS